MVSVISQNFQRRGSSQENPESFSGGVEIDIVPPFESAHLLQVMRHLESQSIKIRQTSGSWNTGCLITAVVENPIPLADILKDIPNVKEIRVINNQQDLKSWEAQPLRVLVSGQRTELSRLSLTMSRAANQQIEAPG